jgi:hypothetical protein
LKRPAAAPLPVRLAWFVGLWAAGVGAVGAIALIARWALR